MTYSISLSEQGNYVILAIAGEINRQSALSLVSEAHALGTEHGIKRYLMDLSQAVNTDSVIEQYEYINVDLAAAQPFDPYARVALLVAPDDHSHDFYETLSLNAGYAVQMFRDMQPAIAYLSE